MWWSMSPGSSPRPRRRSPRRRRPGPGSHAAPSRSTAASCCRRPLRQLGGRTAGTAAPALPHPRRPARRRRGARRPRRGRARSSTPAWRSSPSTTCARPHARGCCSVRAGARRARDVLRHALGVVDSSGCPPVTSSARCWTSRLRRRLHATPAGTPAPRHRHRRGRPPRHRWTPARGGRPADRVCRPRQDAQREAHRLVGALVVITRIMGDRHPTGVRAPVDNYADGRGPTKPSRRTCSVWAWSGAD